MKKHVNSILVLYTIGFNGIFNVVLGVFQSTQIHQPASFLAAQLGDQVTFECYVKREILYMVWYKLTTGRNMHHVAKADMFYKWVHYFDNFKDGRFNVTLKEGTSHLKVSSTKPEDAGIYYCGVVQLNYIEFGPGTLLVLKGADLNSTVTQQPVSDSVHPGDSVTLNCTINTETCEGEHSVYWFRHDSGESPPGIIYTNGDRSGQCMKSPESGSPTQSCVYNLPKRNLSLSDTGTYYCAVASCGEILFGNGTKLNFNHYAFCYVSTPQNQNSDVLNYAAVRFNPKKSSSARRVKDKTVRRDAVYSEVRYLQQE
uniref:Ig-like domain-containing protein n=1 Tax=Esox lucius TaxID=8010 RepID=A0A3P8Z213_ESOLU